MKPIVIATTLALWAAPLFAQLNPMDYVIEASDYQHNMLVHTLEEKQLCVETPMQLRDHAVASGLVERGSMVVQLARGPHLMILLVVPAEMPEDQYGEGWVIYGNEEACLLQIAVHAPGTEG